MHFFHFIVRRVNGGILVDDSHKELRLPKRCAMTAEEAARTLLAEIALPRGEWSLRKIHLGTHGEVFEIVCPNIFAPTRSGFFWWHLGVSDTFDPLLRAAHGHLQADAKAAA